MIGEINKRDATPGWPKPMPRGIIGAKEELHENLIFVTHCLRFCPLGRTIASLRAFVSAGRAWASPKPSWYDKRENRYNR